MGYMLSNAFLTSGTREWISDSVKKEWVARTDDSHTSYRAFASSDLASRMKSDPRTKWRPLKVSGWLSPGVFIGSSEVETHRGRNSAWITKEETGLRRNLFRIRSNPPRPIG